MKIIGQMEKWGAGVLGLVSLVLLVHLVLQYKRERAANLRPAVKTSHRAKASTSPGAKAAAAKPKIPDDLSRYDSLLELELLKELEERPLPEMARNPFEFVGGRAPAPTVQQAAAPAPPQAQPPPPPPVSLKLMGYSEGNGGVKEAMVSDEDQVFVVHEGDSIGTRYKVIKITSTVITVEDATVHQTVDLPVPQ